MDSNITEIQWSVEDLIFVWSQLLNVLRDINSVSDPMIHSEGIQAISDIIEILQQAEENIPQNARKKMKYPTLNLVDIFGRLLFEAALISSSSFITGKAYAIGTLCRMIVRHNIDSVPLELLSHFYATVYNCLKNNPNSIVSQAILQHSSNIFNLALPGSSILIPHYISEIKSVLGSITSCPPSIRMRCVILTCSLICYPGHLEAVSCPTDMINSSGAYDFSKVCIFFIYNPFFFLL